MTLLAMLVAVLIVLAFVNIPMPLGLSITFNMIPVAIAAMAMGVPGGMIIGGAFGLSPLGAALVNVSPVLMFIQRFVSRVLVGALAAVVYRAMCRTKAPLYVRGAVTGFSAAFFNTLFFMSLLVLFFGGTDKLAGPIAEKGVIMYIITSVGINAVVEMAVAAVVTGAAGVALKKARLIQSYKERRCACHDPDHGYRQHQHQDGVVRRQGNVQVLAYVDEYHVHFGRIRRTPHVHVRL